MPALRFCLADRNRFPPWGESLVYAASADGTPWECRIGWSGDELIVEREVDDSALVCVPWRIDGHGEMLLATSTLLVRDRPYLLDLELARGTLNRVRNQRAAWESAGMLIPPEADAAIEAALAALVRVITAATPAEAAESSSVSLGRSLDAAHQLAAEYVRQVLEIRRRQTPRLPTLLAANLGYTVPSDRAAAVLRPMLAAAVVPMTWRRIEPDEGRYRWGVDDQQLQWCHKSGLKVCGGPLVRMDRQGLPDWLYLWEDNFQQLRQRVVRFVEAAVERFRGQVHLWQAASRISDCDDLALDEGHRIHLVAEIVEAIRRLDPRTPVFITFNQPWGEYMARRDFDFGPLQLADALVRAEMGISALGLEINMQYWPGGTPQRDPLQLSQLIDQWAVLGLPLIVSLTAPSGGADDAQPAGRCRILSNGAPDALTPLHQQRIVEQVVPMLLAKQCVHAVIWNQLIDRPPYEWPHGGLFDAQGRAKPALETLVRLRQEYLA